MVPYLAIGLFGGYLIRMVFAKHELAKAADDRIEAYHDRCKARMDAQYVERLLVSEIREL